MQQGTLGLGQIRFPEPANQTKGSIACLGSFFRLFISHLIQYLVFYFYLIRFVCI